MNKHLLIALNCSIVAGLAFLFGFRAEAQSGGVDTTFKPGFDGDVFTMRIQPNGKLLVSGFFSKVGNERQCNNSLERRSGDEVSGSIQVRSQ